MTGYPELVSVASQSRGGVTSGESKKDHGCTAEDYDDCNGVTLCGRKMRNYRWFPRHERFDGRWSFHCKQCVRVAVKRGLLDPTQIAKHFTPGAQP